MAAGEAWVFDNWREHKVENPTPDARMHLVADTAGTSAFWRLVRRARSEDFERPNPDARLIAFDPAARPRLLIERFNAAPVMPPSEVEQLAFDLLADLAPADDAARNPLRRSTSSSTLSIEFCHDWRSLWYAARRRAGGSRRHTNSSWCDFARSCASCRPCASPVRATARRRS